MQKEREHKIEHSDMTKTEYVQAMKLLVEIIHEIRNKDNKKGE